jgi:hypothetical protein
MPIIFYSKPNYEGEQDSYNEDDLVGDCDNLRFVAYSVTNSRNQPAELFEEADCQRKTRDIDRNSSSPSTPPTRSFKARPHG